MLATSLETTYSCKNGPSLDAVAMINKFELPNHPIKNRKKIDHRVQKLFEALQEIPDPAITCTGFDSELTGEEEETFEIWLEYIESTLNLLRGKTFEMIQRQVRYYLPKKAALFSSAVDAATNKLIEFEAKLKFILDESVNEEWLPSPAAPGTFGKSDGPVSFDEL